MTVVTESAPKSVSPQELADLLWSTDPKLNEYMFEPRRDCRRLICLSYAAMSNFSRAV